MSTAPSELLKHLLTLGEVASLGTLHKGEPAVSMVPYALLPHTGELIIHVSGLAAHTQDMQRHASVSLMVMGERLPDTPPQGLPRVTLVAIALFCPSESPRYAEAKAAYLKRFPTAEPLFDFSDFSLVLLVPKSARVVGGFAQAWSLTADKLRQAFAVDGSTPSR